MSAKNQISNLLAKADVKINGKRSWDIQVKNEALYSRLMSQGSMGLGESYMDGWWESAELDEFFSKILSADLSSQIKPSPALIFSYLRSKMFNLQKSSRAFQIGERHYDVGNDLYQVMLDKRMVYTCAYWDKGAKNLDAAQEDKLDLVCKKMKFKKGQRVLDIGCGWGSFAKYAAEKCGVKVVGVTVSKNQVKLGNKLCKGLPVELRLQDYRELNEKFDHIVSLGMFEHVGKKNYRTYMEVASRNLKDNGLFLLQTIGSNLSTKSLDPWIEKYIFPNSILPSISEIAKASENIFIMEDWHNFSYDYYLTLKSWFNNFDSHWDELKQNYDQRFYNMWKYYLKSTAGGFKSRSIQLWQVVLSKHGVTGGYKSVR
ncbi:MAG: cyclopropane-fatty-acyl-phospholipid synthase [Parcubacteria group bacterium]|jgi:cyclopropane-fatty-acyl-phospholipid synthase|nr:cyclopropane-fatty-acyl-phospholipid synthase [Parcubacteria group bacterium]|tara:strand:- start:653 stop:1768 length:1116 start_codon:yes stop_codon:yes gene_type:complete